MTKQYILPSLPYDLDGLEPYISKKILNLHYNKHHAAYVNNLNNAIQEFDPTLFESFNETTLAFYINAFPEPVREKIKNNLGGHINHSFFWNLLTKEDTSKSKKEITSLLEKSTGSLESIIEELKITGKTFFGSGWVWLVWNPLTESAEVRTYTNQDTPLFENMYPILGIDLWEHSYYLQYTNNKAEYIDQIIKIINWEYALQLLLSYKEKEDRQEQKKNK
jgi:Fe-Mn family superoxide dismutase